MTEAFRAHDWPGNVRELENVLMKAVALCSSDVITTDLMPELMHSIAPAAPGMAWPREPMALNDVEAAHVLRVLEETH